VGLMFGWFKKKEPIQTGMDKHTKRYLGERFDMYEEHLGFGRAIQCINEADGWDDIAYLSAAIDSNFTGEQKQYLQHRIWDKHYGRES
jgi:hypothetical protein